MWLLIVVDKCVLLTANFVGFYFVKMSNFVTLIFLDEKRGLQSNFGFDLLKIEGHNY